MRPTGCDGSSSSGSGSVKNPHLNGMAFKLQSWALCDRGVASRKAPSIIYNGVAHDIFYKVLYTMLHDEP